ncbi:hypothetical protein KU6B_02800 [Mameliella alba]|nr:hypothetical protein KU6B_02800 [Mameliella alba]
MAHGADDAGHIETARDIAHGPTGAQKAQLGGAEPLGGPRTGRIRPCIPPAKSNRPEPSKSALTGRSWRIMAAG